MLAAFVVLALALAAALLPAEGDARADVRLRVTIPVENTGTGTVSGPGIDCPGACTEFFPEGTVVTLQGNPEQGSELTWGEACEGTPAGADCVVTATGSITRVTAVFTQVGPGPGGDETAPRTTIVKAPKRKVKTKRSKARVSFEFESNEKRSTFECRFDDKPFESCASPLQAKAKLGKHTFDVRATDAAGNTDASPARAAFKVVKKKKRK